MRPGIYEIGPARLEGIRVGVAFAGEAALAGALPLRHGCRYMLSLRRPASKMDIAVDGEKK